jgi:drug/metabolite transporter (DMT)-like permease
VALIFRCQGFADTKALIANCLFAPLILRERFHVKELVGMGLAALGAITVVFSSSQNNPRVRALMSRSGKC